MHERVHVIGRGRVGAALAARLAERGLTVTERDADLVVLCVPDAAIRAVAASVAVGPWVAHVSGATALAALDPHVNRFGVHPLQTFTRRRGAEQFDGAWGAISADSADGVAHARWLAETLGLQPIVIADGDRAQYHAAASIASNYLVTIYRAAARLIESAGVPAQALVPLMQRTIDNGFELTGPIARGDAGTIDAHLDAIARFAPDLAPMYKALAAVTKP
jgi:predicted short-subunit dehydrogenase-like oxidoreductase (DUF2520 family)